MSTRNILQDALLILEQGWTQGAVARRDDDTTCPTCDRDATQFSIIGAIWRAAEVNGGGDYEYRVAFMRVNEQFYGSAAVWNDDESRTFPQVREMMMRAAGSNASSR